MLSPSTWLTDEQADALRSIGSRRSAPAGVALFTEGDDPYDVLLLEHGRVKVVTTAPNGHEVVLAILGPGAVVGELAVIDDGPRSAAAITVEPVEATAIHGRAFLDFLDAHPCAQRALLELTVARLRHSNHRQLEYSSVDALGRVCRRLDELTDETPGDQEITVELGLTQTEFAQWCGLSREAVVKALRRLRDLGWISQRESTVVIHDRVAVRTRGAG